jgi:hypothetical protein
MPLSTPTPLGEVLFEFRQLGSTVKVSAVHVATNTEVAVVGPPGAGEVVLRNLALQKLRYVLGKQGMPL